VGTQLRANAEVANLFSIAASNASARIGKMDTKRTVVGKNFWCVTAETKLRENVEAANVFPIAASNAKTRIGNAETDTHVVGKSSPNFYLLHNK
jgi:hypothetical protein